MASILANNVETDGESPFLVMQFVAGESLEQRLDRDGPLQLCEILRIASQTAAGLAAAHAQGLVHRDVKPSNILLERGLERTLLTDFGLARASDDASLTRTGFHPGTPQYMSPEQARGDAVDARSDLFSLGSVIYAMCTGRSPFRAETIYGILRRITDNEPRSIREVNSEIPQWLERIVQQLLAKPLQDRFQSAEQVAELLQRCLAHVQQPTTVELPAECKPLASEKKLLPATHRLVAASLASVLLCAIAMPFAGSFFQPQDLASDDAVRNEQSIGGVGELAKSFDSLGIGNSWRLPLPQNAANEIDTVWDAAAERLRSYDQDFRAFERRTQRNWEAH